MSGVCQCHGHLEKKTYQQAWAARGVSVKSDAPSATAECWQCNKCDTIYHLSEVVSGEVESMDQTNASRKDYGFARG